VEETTVEDAIVWPANRDGDDVSPGHQPGLARRRTPITTPGTVAQAEAA